MDLGALIPLLTGLVDDAGLFPPSSLPMDAALKRHRASASSSPLLSGRFLCPGDRVEELLLLLDPDERLEVHLIGETSVELPDDPRLMVHAVELRSGMMPELPCYVEGVRPSELKEHGVFGKIRCGGARIPSVAELTDYIAEAVQVSLPFKGTAGMHAAVRGWESTAGVPHHGYLNLLLAVGRAVTHGDIADVLFSTDASALAAEARSLPHDVTALTRWMFHSYGSCDTARPIQDARELGLL